MGRNFTMNGDAPAAFVWFFLLVVHFVYAFEIWSRIVDRMTQHEIETLQRKGYRVTPSAYAPSQKAAQGVKQKREQVARLSDDGEIIYEEPPRAPSRQGKRNDQVADDAGHTHERDHRTL